MALSSKFLDEQSLVKIDRWVDIDSDECKVMDDDHDFTKKVQRMGFQDPPFLFTDSDGRIWGKGEGDRFYPFHFEYGKKLIGYRISKKASN